MRVCLGGTFDLLHAGHHRLLQAALDALAEAAPTEAAPAEGGAEASAGTGAPPPGVGEGSGVQEGDAEASASQAGARLPGASPPHGLLIGLTTDGFAARRRERAVSPYREREAALRAWLGDRGAPDAEIVPLTAEWGPAAAGPEFTAIVVSTSTRATAARLNAHRAAEGVAPLAIIEVPHLLAQDGRPLSASRIRAGEIDARGVLQGAVRIAAGTRNPAKLRGLASVVQRVWPGAEVRPREVASDVPPQPRDGETLRGAINRARAALREGDALACGIEAGLLWNGDLEQWLDVQYCAVVDHAGRVTVGHGGGFLHPPAVLAAVKAGATVGAAVARLADAEQGGASGASGASGVGGGASGTRGGAIGFLTGGLLERDALTAHAVWMALVPRLRPPLYG